MKLFKKWFKKEKPDVQFDEPENWNEIPVLKREDVNIHDENERKKYLKNCLEQIADATTEINTLRHEYTLVTDYLTDMEELETLPEEELEKLREETKKVAALQGERKRYTAKPNRMTDTQYRNMERIEDDMPEAYDKLVECETYQDLIRQDLRRLEGEKHAYYYRQNELLLSIGNLRGLSKILVIAASICIVMLIILQIGFEMDTQIGYLLTAGATAVALTWLFIKYKEEIKERKKIEQLFNKVILLQNKVKIRYVNNTNLLEYLNTKYRVHSAKELKKLWDAFLEERSERERYDAANADLDFFQGEFVKILRSYRIKDPLIWLHQTEAILDGKEMVEVRHGLIVRRQKLRKQMEFNTANAEAAQTEIKSLAEDYPQYASEILKIVSDYERAVDM